MKEYPLIKQLMLMSTESTLDKRELEASSPLEIAEYFIAKMTKL